MGLANYDKAFIPGSPALPDEFFVGRTKELKEAIRTLDNYSSDNHVPQYSRHILITGPRGVGKTTLLQFIMSHYLGDKKPTSYPECSRTMDFENAMIDAFRGYGMEFFETLDQEGDDNSSGGNLYLGIGNMRGSKSKSKNQVVKIPAASLKNHQSAFHEIQKTGNQWIFAIDEISEVPCSGEGELFWENLAYLARILSNQWKSCNGTRLLLAGLDSSSENLLSMHPSLARNFEIIKLKPILDRDIEHFLQLAEIKYGIGFQPGVASRLVDECAGLPYYVHLMGSSSCKMALDRGEKNTIYFRDLANAFYHEYEKNKPSINKIYGKRLTKLNSDDSSLLEMIASMNKFSFSGADLAEYARLSDADADRYYRKIKNNLSDFVRERRSRGKLCFRTPFLKGYCRQLYGKPMYWGPDNQLPLGF
jgi:DNA polymerase III delta prime subunit